MNVFGIQLIGLTPENARKLLLTLALIVVVLGVRYAAGWALGRGARSGESAGTGHRSERRRFWVKQGVSLLALALIVLGVLSVWVDNPSRLATVAGLITAGVAIALQRVITSFAAYFIILRGRVFTIGDRITMGGVRGDVVALGFMQTAVMEMGQPPAAQSNDPAVWVEARQYTGRLVRVTNDKIFDSPVYNYTREFPYLWEEIHLPVSYKDDRKRAEEILLEAARNHASRVIEEAQGKLRDLQRAYFLPEPVDLDPRVYWRLTDNWLELTVRFLVPERGIRAIKDAMSREILTALDAAGIGIASGTYEIVGMPPIRVELRNPT